MINSAETYLGASKQQVRLLRTSSRTAIATGYFSVFDLSGTPAGGVLNAGNTANGVVPTDSTAGAPIINAFSVGAMGHLATVSFGSSVACRMTLFDRLFHAGAYSFNSNVTLASQPSFSTRVDGDYKDTEIWIEAVTAFTGNLSVNITYTNQDGVTGRTVGVQALGLAPTLGRMMPIALQSGDTGVQKIESVVASVSTVGTFNVLIIRPIWSGRVKFAGDGDLHGILKTGLPQVYEDSCLHLMVAPDSTATGVSEVLLTIANG